MIVGYDAYNGDICISYIYETNAKSLSVVKMPLVGDIHGSNGIDLANKYGSDNGNETNLAQLLMNLVTSGNEKHVKLASDILDLDLIKGNASDNLGLNDSGNNEQELTIDNNSETDMEWTTVKPKNKRVRSNSNESEKIVDITVSPNKKQKSNRPNNQDDKSNGNKNDDSYRKQGQGQSGQNTRTKPEIRTRNALSKDSVLVTITEIPENTYFNSIKMENMILNSFPKLKETGMWTKYRVNKRHQGKCYVTLPKDHFNENVSEVIKSQTGFQNSKVKVIKGINDVPEKAHKVHCKCQGFSLGFSSVHKVLQGLYNLCKGFTDKCLEENPIKGFPRVL